MLRAGRMPHEGLTVQAVQAGARTNQAVDAGFSDPALCVTSVAGPRSYASSPALHCRGHPAARPAPPLSRRPQDCAVGFTATSLEFRGTPLVQSSPVVKTRTGDSERRIMQTEVGSSGTCITSVPFSRSLFCIGL